MSEQYDPERVKGDRKRRVTIEGAQVRAMQDAIDYLDGPAWYDDRRRRQIANHLRKTVSAYRTRDRVVEIAGGAVKE